MQPMAAHGARRLLLVSFVAATLLGACVVAEADVRILDTGSAQPGADASLDAADAGAEAGTAPDAADPDAPAEPEVAVDADTGSPDGVGVDAAPDTGPTEPGPLTFTPVEPVLARLTIEQYRNALRDLFGPGLPVLPLEPDTNPYLFKTIGAAQTELSASGVERYAESAFAIADAVFADDARRGVLLDCEPASPDDGCAERFVRAAGLRLFRRPLTDDEVVRWLGVSRDLSDGDALLGLETVLAGMLQAPHFLYRVEIGEPDVEAPGRRRYTSWEMAQRLSFLLWNTAPDLALLEAAERGELVDDDSIKAHVRRMLDDERARIAVQDFFSQYLDLGRLHGIERDPARYPCAGPELYSAMETELRLLVDDAVFRRDLDIRELFSAPRGYVNTALANLYGVDAPGASPVAFVPVEFPPQLQRAGILTLGAFLTMNAHQTETSPTLRGKYVRERVLCTPVPPPPDEVDLNLDRGEGDPPTLRERLEQHREDPACAGCHSFIDPPGFLFEHYDSLGQYREEAEGHPIHAAGDLDGTPLADASELAAMLRHDIRVGNCVARQLYRHASARLETVGEREILRDLQNRFAASGYRFRELLVALALSEGFRTAAEPSETSPEAP